jgi:hypothetical protein
MGVGGATMVGLPLLDAMLDDRGEALAEGGPLPVRLVLWAWSHGANPEDWVPASTGRGKAWSLSPALRDFAPVKEYLSVLTGTNNPRKGHPGLYAMFSGFVPTSAGFLEVLGPTFDQLAAKSPHMVSRSGLRSLELGVTRNPNTDYRSLSFNGPGRANLPDTNPVAVFNRIFRGLTVQGGTRRPVLVGDAGADASWILDTIKDDIRRLQQRLGANDRTRLGEHLDALHDIERRVRARRQPTAVSPACRLPGQPFMDIPLPNDGTPAHDEAMSALADIMSDIAALVMACDQSRILSIAYTLPAGQDRFSGYTSAEHGITHKTHWPSVGWPKLGMKMRALARLVQKMASVKEGPRTMLHNAVVFATTDCTEPASHSGQNLPILLAGRAGGRLVGDVHVSAPGASSFRAGATVVEALRIEERPFAADPVPDLLA